MHLVLIGDVGWQRLYHLGDEAMTEYAIDALRARGVERISLIAGDPAHAAQMYEVETLPRLGHQVRRRRGNRQRQDAVLAHLAGERSLPADDPALAVIDAVRQCDGVLICGGGNLNSMYDLHIFERSTLAKIATALGKPYALSSQTLGPLIYESDRPLMSELVAGAVVVGARESFTHALASDLGGPAAQVRSQMDDAYSLGARAGDRTAVADLVGEPFVIASFAQHPASPALELPAYRDMVAQVCRQVAERTRRRVLLVPHAGALAGQEPVQDQLANQEVVTLADHVKVEATRTLTSRQLVALTEAADLVVGSRYHAGIMAARAATPYLAAVPNLYSSVRMRGAARNMGMESFVLPFDHDPAPVIETAVALLDDPLEHDRVAEHMRSVAALRSAEHADWWDALLAAFGPERTPANAPFAEVPVLENRAVSAEVSATSLDAIERYGMAYAVAKRAKDDRIAELRDESRALKRRAKRAEGDLAALTAERAAEPSRPVRAATRRPVRAVRRLARRIIRRR